MERLIFTFPKRATFINLDIKILSRKFDVIINEFNWSRKWMVPILMFLQLFRLIFQVPKSKAILVSFGGYWAFWPTLFGKVFRKPAYLILHGTDACRIPAINYGHFRKRLLSWVCRKSYRWSTELFPVSESLILTENNHLPFLEMRQGFEMFVRGERKRSRIIPNGFEITKWYCDQQVIRKKTNFISVLSQGQFQRKGLDTLVNIASIFPHCTFFVAGIEKPPHGIKVGSNVSFLGRLNQEKLRTYYSKSQFYFQLSIFEGFGCTLCEAMLCECIPVGSEVNFIPEIINHTGPVLQKQTAESLEKLIQQFLNLQSTRNLGKLARFSIMKRFSITIRSEKLLDSMDKVEH